MKLLILKIKVICPPLVKNFFIIRALRVQQVQQDVSEDSCFYDLNNQQYYIESKMSSHGPQIMVCKNFKLVKKLGTGAFGQIYLAQNISNPNERHAAKLQQNTSKFPQLYHQAKMYKYLSSFNPVVGIPKVYSFTAQGQYNVMLMDLLGPSLEDLFNENGKKLSLKTVLQIGEQMIQRIQLVQEKHILHRDIKPDNFLMGIGKNAHIMYIVDFGLSKKFEEVDKHIPYKEGKQLTGTARYASINTHMGIQQSRRDDIESIGYVLMYLLRGILPWQNMKAKDTKTKYKMIMEKKISTPAEFLCKGFPNQFVQLINYAKALKFQERPDYKYLKGLLAQAKKTNKIETDYVYDWGAKTTTQNLTFQPPETKLVEPKVQHIKNIKQEAINQALNTFQINTGIIGASQLKSGQMSQSGKRKDKQVKDLNKSLNKNGQTVVTKNQNNILSSIGLQTLVSTKITMPKISVIRK